MKHLIRTTILCALVFTGATPHLQADPVEETLDNAFGKLEESVPGKFNLAIRNRYEVFDLSIPAPNLPVLDRGPADRDGASTRIRYGYTTPDFNGLSAMVEGETVTRLGGDATDIHPLDNLGDGTDLNQAWVQYIVKDFAKAKVGRQIYALDDQRFIGHVGWRQNIQTFDAATGAFTAVEDLSFKAFYIDAVNNVAAANNESDILGLNGSYTFADWLNLTAFYYDMEVDDAVAQSNETFGVRATGTHAFDAITLKYAVSTATQSEGSNAQAEYDADYYAGDLSGTYKGFTLGGGVEILEPDFRTPLATVHKFNGFADVFLPVTGLPQGIEDYYIYAGYKIPIGEKKFIPVKVIYHWFDPESGDGDYGEEIDFVASYKINKYLSLLTKYGSYETDGGAGGVGGADKEMFTFEVNFTY